MDELAPCTECNRHARATEGSCPFCGAALNTAEHVPMPNRRMSRAAIVAFGASLAAGFVATGCGSDDDDAGSGGSAGTGGSATGGAAGSGGATGGQGGATGGQGGAAGAAGNAGAGNFGGLYGAPPFDAGSD